MRRLGLALSVLLLGACASRPPPRSPAYPPARRVDVVDTIHGVRVADPYRWLEDGTSPEVVEWMRAQDALARAELARLPLRDRIARRIDEVMLREQAGWGPVRLGARLFYERRPAGRERPLVYVREADGRDRTLLDPDAWSKDGSSGLGAWYPSWDGAKVLYQVRRNNADAAVLRVMDVATGQVSAIDVVDGAEWPSASWNERGDGFYYQWLPTDPKLHAERWAHGEGRFHRLGDDPKNDVVVRPPTPGQLGTTLSTSKGSPFLFAEVHRGWGQVDLYFEDQRDAKPAWRTITAGADGLAFAQGLGDAIYVHTTIGAPNGRIVRVDPARPARAAWVDVVHERDVPILEWGVVGGRIVVQVMKDVTTRTEIYAPTGGAPRVLAAHGATATFPSGPADADEAYVTYESFESPPEVWRVSIASGDEQPWWRESVPADLSRYATEQVFYPSKDGTKVPLFIVRAKDAPRDGSAPLLLYGYGAANGVERPSFRGSIVPWLEQGGTFAVAGIRGGGEYGEAWHRAGNLRNKQTTFDDFLAAAEYLAKNGYTSRERLAIRGGSWGGLLVTACLTQRPDLFGAVIAEVPQTDMIRFPLTGLGKSPIAEFGDPANADDFRALLAYSPYHHVAAGTRYPPVLVTAADADERVDALHARKMVAALQAANPANEVLLRVDWNAGHHGSGKVRDEAAKRADEYAFVLEAMRIGRAK